jgi:hypothetical protein
MLNVKIWNINKRNEEKKTINETSVQNTNIPNVTSYTTRPTVLNQACKILYVRRRRCLLVANSCHLEPTLDDAVEFLKRNALERGEDPDHTHEEKTVTISIMTEGFENTEGDKERVATTRQWIVRMPTVRRTRRSRTGLFLASRQCFISSGHFQGLVHRHLYCSRQSVSFLNCYLFVRIHIFFYNFVSKNVY